MVIHDILKKYWGYDSFRPLQEEIIRTVLKGNDTLALLPTGGGKSICFQVPAMSSEGLCIVVSPLIALMKDQVENLTRKNIKAMAITSAMSKKEIDVALDNCAYGNFKFLYVSPERLNTEIFKIRVKKMKVSLIAIDEAHCISQWGYDFRPSYLKIAELRELLPNIPLLALTATATAEVVKDIQQKLLFKKENVQQKSFARENLAYVVLTEEDKLKRLLKIGTKIKGTGIVYVRNRKKTKQVSDFLNLNNIVSDYYHAGLTPHLRDTKQMRWIEGKIRVIVCTNAFGMGIDKPNVRFVAHLDLPDCLEAYFQEAGRAGRDEKKAFAVLLYNQNDKLELEGSVQKSFPPIEEIKRTYQALINFFKLAIGTGEGSSFDFDLSLFCETFKMNAGVVFNALKLLEKENYLALTEAVYQPSRIHFSVHHDELYKFQVANPKYDEFIKLILRSYSGVFDEFVKISEAELSRRGKINYEDVVKLLEYFQKMNLISYQPQTDFPQIIFTQNIVPVTDLRLAKENYSGRKAKAMERADAMIHYATETHLCRGRVLLAYFGETNADDCGVCDICLENKRKNLTHAEFEQILEEIVNILSMHTLTLKELVEHIPDHREEKILKVLQWLMDNNEVLYDDDNKLCLSDR